MLRVKLPMDRPVVADGEWHESPSPNKKYVGGPRLGDLVRMVEKVGCKFLVLETRVGMTHIKTVVGEYDTEQQAERAARRK